MDRKVVLDRDPFEMDFIRRQQMDETDEVGEQIVSLRCPLAITRIRIPVRFHLCKHPLCFDLDTYLAMEAKVPRNKCPVCNAEGRGDLRVCAFTLWMLEHNPDCMAYGISSSVIKPVSWQEAEGLNECERETIVID